MKVILVNGSPHENGCTYRALKEAEKADMELKDQSVFLNPYMNDIKAEALPPELEKLESSEKMEKSVSLGPDDDIMDLLKYCEDKLNS